MIGMQALQGSVCARRCCLYPINGNRYHRDEGQLDGDPKHEDDRHQGLHGCAEHDVDVQLNRVDDFLDVLRKARRQVAGFGGVEESHLLAEQMPHQARAQAHRRASTEQDEARAGARRCVRTNDSADKDLRYSCVDLRFPPILTLLRSDDQLDALPNVTRNHRLRYLLN